MNRKKNAADIGEDTCTQFAYACRQLGVALEFSSVPQAKGRVERMFETLQSSLPVELRLAGITGIEAANEFPDSYIDEFNAWFALPANHIKSVFETQPSEETLNLTLALSIRKQRFSNWMQWPQSTVRWGDAGSLPQRYKGHGNPFL